MRGKKKTTLYCTAPNLTIYDTCTLSSHFEFSAYEVFIEFNLFGRRGTLLLVYFRFKNLGGNFTFSKFFARPVPCWRELWLFDEL